RSIVRARHQRPTVLPSSTPALSREVIASQAKHELECQSSTPLLPHGPCSAPWVSRRLDQSCDYIETTAGLRVSAESIRNAFDSIEQVGEADLFVSSL